MLTLHAPQFPMLQNRGNLLPSHPVPSESDSYTREQRIPSIAPVFTHIFSRYGYQMDCKPQPHSLTASGSCASVSRCSVFKVQRRWANYHPFGGAHRYDTGETLAGEVLLDLCTYDSMNIKSCQKVTES